MPTRRDNDRDAARRRLAVELRQLRREAGLTQERLAAKAGYSRVYVTLVETARETPGQQFIEHIETALNAHGRLAPLYAKIRHDDQSTVEEVNSSQTRAKPVVRSAPSIVRAPTSAVDALQSFRAADRLLGGGHLYDTVTDYLRSEVAPRLVEMDRTDGQAHFVAAAGLMDMAGWMAYDTGRPELANDHFRRALRFVTVGGDDQLHGHIYSGLSHLAHHLGAPRDAIELARAGHRALGSGRRRPQLHARLLTMQARGHAALQDAEECARLLKQAERTLSQPADEEASVWVSAFDDGAFTSEAATCMQSLGQVRSAEQHARRVIELRPRHRPRSRALGQLSLVSALLAQGRAEEACEVAADILSATASLRSTVVLDRLGELHAQLEQHRLDRSVADFLECLRTTLHERERQA